MQKRIYYERLLMDSQLENLLACSDQNFVSSIAIILIKEKENKLKLDLKVLNRPTHKNKRLLRITESFIQLNSRNLNSTAP